MSYNAGMEHNPYSPPKAPLDGADHGSPTALFYSPAQLAVAALLGGLIPVGVMMAANLRALGWKRQSALAVFGSLLATIGLFYFGQKFAQIPVLVSTALVALLVYGIARPAFGGALARHLAAGRPMASWWRVLGIALLWALIIGVLAVFVIEYVRRNGVPST